MDRNHFEDQEGNLESLVAIGLLCWGIQGENLNLKCTVVTVPGYTVMSNT